jgi:hypothetical protein
VNLEAMQTFCHSDGVRLPEAAKAVERSGRLEHAERSERAKHSIDESQNIEAPAGQYLPRVMERQSNYFDLFLKEELAHRASAWSNVWWTKWCHVSQNVSPTSTLALMNDLWNVQRRLPPAAKRPS